jgi:hypothetical protein
VEFGEVTPLSTDVIVRALAQAEYFASQGTFQLATQKQPEARYLVSAAPVPTALAILALSIPGINAPLAVDKGAKYLEMTQLADDGWGNIPEGPSNALATAICSKGLQASVNCVNFKELIYDAAYLIAKTWTQDFNRLAPDWLPKQNSPVFKLVEAISGKPLIPTLDTLTLKDLSIISHYMPPYGRPTILAVTLIKFHYRYGHTEEVKIAARELVAQISDNGSWCDDIVVTSMAMLALYLAEVYEPLQHAAQWLCDTQYAHGGWPSFNQLTNWAVGWAGYLLGPLDQSLRRSCSSYLQRALNSDSSLGTAPPNSYPDLDDTSIGLLALAADPEVPRSVLLPIKDLLLKLQNRDGSWSTFPSFAAVPPRCTSKFPVYIKSEDITVHVLLALLTSGMSKDSPQISKAVNWLIKRQNPDGTWNSTWFLGQTYATAQVIDLLLYLEPECEAVTKGLTSLINTQTSEGAWHTGSAGECGLAIYALLRAGVQTDNEVITRGLRYLLSLQQPDGSFRPFYSGFYASGLYYEEPLSEAMAAARALRFYLHLINSKSQK